MVDISRVLIASEDPHRRRELASALAVDGHEAQEIRTALELLHRVGVGPRAREAPPDALVLDTTGRSWATVDMLEAVGAEDWALPVIALVRAGDADARAEAERLGAKAVLELPVDPPTLRAEVAAFVFPARLGSHRAMHAVS
jgi:DNA-binding NtrC family response regulator